MRIDGITDEQICRIAEERERLKLNDSQVAEWLESYGLTDLTQAKEANAQRLIDLWATFGAREAATA